MQENVRRLRFHWLMKSSGGAALFALFSVLVISFVVPSASANNRASLDTFEVGVLHKLNLVRADHGLPPLKLSTRLTTAADAHTVEMASDGYFDHSSRDGTPFWKRVDRWYGKSGFHSWAVGENILWSSPNLTPGRAMALWMASPEHRANILSAHWHEIGVAAVHENDGPGVYHGLPVTIITTDFGSRH
jgi:uncharacterized protein YkwD